MALVSCSPRPEPGSCGALDGAAGATAAGGSIGAVFETPVAPCRFAPFAGCSIGFAIFVHRRSDSVEQPIEAAASTRVMPDATSFSASACCAAVNRLPLLGVVWDLPLRAER